MRAAKPEERLNVAHVAKGAGERYNSLPDSEKAKYQNKSVELKAQWERDMQTWKESLSPEDIKAENAFRTQQRKAGKSRKSNLKDPHAPKKPLSAYFLFLRVSSGRVFLKRDMF
jgi:DNA phosphorothioation-dependent restriction protein DptG